MAASGGRLKLLDIQFGCVWIVIVSLVMPILTAQSLPQRRDTPVLSGGYRNMPKEVYACEGSEATVRCPISEKIHIIRANYGRLKVALCKEEDAVTDGWNLQCLSTRSPHVVMNICEGKRLCKVQANNRLFGDPCYLTPKYLNIQFECRKEWVLPTTTEPVPTEEPTSRPTLRPTMTTSTVPPTPNPTLEPVTNTTSQTVAPIQTEIPATSHPKPTTPGPPERQVCPSQVHREVQWPDTPPGAVAITDCPNNIRVRRAVWRCQRDPVQWEGEPDLSKCVSQSMKQLQNKISEAQSELGMDMVMVEEVAHSITDLSTAPMYGGDLVESMDLMSTVVGSFEKESSDVDKETRKKFVENVNKEVLKTSSNLLEDDKTWQDLPQAMQAETATKMISNVEKGAKHLAQTLDQPQVIINVTINIVLELNIIDTLAQVVKDAVYPQPMEHGGKYNHKQGGDTIRIPGGSLREISPEGLARVMFLTYKNLEKWLHPQNDQAPLSPERHGHHSVSEVRGPPVETVYFDDHGRPHSEQPVQPSGSDKTQPQGDQENKDLQITDQKPETNVGDEDEGMNEEIVIVENEMLGEVTKPKNLTTIVNSNVISASIIQENKTSVHTNLKEPILYTLEHKSDKNVYNPTCSFWEYSEKTLSGSWQTFGCSVVHTNTTHTTCSCTHVTNFAVLMDVRGVELSDEHKFSLTFITYFGCMVSIICLFLAFLTFTCFKNLQCDRNTIHKNLVAMLCVAEIIFLAGIGQTHNQVLCTVVGVMLHYAFLASFMWMLMEGIMLYVMLVEVFEPDKSRVKYYYLAAYGVPLVIVGISMAVNYQGYSTQTSCWLTTENGFIFAFVGPVIAIMCVNALMLSVAIYKMCVHVSNTAQWKVKPQSKKNNIKSWVKGAAVLVVLLGLTWTFGLLYLDDTHTLTFAYVFTIFNSLQGLFIFVFHCCMNEKVRKEYKRCVRHAACLPEWVRVKYGGKPGASTTPASSSNGLSKKLPWRKRSSSSSILRSSSTSKGRYHTVKMPPDNKQINDALHTDSGIAHCEPNASAIYSEIVEDNDYLEPISLVRGQDSMMAAIDKDYSQSQMEGSVCDTEYMLGRDANSTPINVEKYKIKASPEHKAPLCTEEDDEEDKKRLSSMSDSTKPLMGEGVYDYEDDTIGREKARLKRLYVDPIENTLQSSTVNNEVNSMNNLNKGSSKCPQVTPDSCRLSRPNINAKMCGGSGDEGIGTSSGSSHGSPATMKNNKLQNDGKDEKAVNKMREAAKGDPEGMITIAHGPKTAPPSRFSSNTKDMLDKQGYRVSSSDA